MPKENTLNFDGIESISKDADFNPKYYLRKDVKLIRITTVPVSLLVLLKHQLNFMSQYYDVIAVSSPGTELREVGEREGVRTVAVEMSRTITPLKDIKAIYLLYRLFKKEKPSIVHTHTPKAGLVGMVAGKLARVPIRLHTVAGLPLMENKGLKRKILECIEWITYKYATKIYPNSSNLASFILDRKYCQSAKLKILGDGGSNGIDTDYFTITNEIIRTSDGLKLELGIKSHEFVFVFIGRVVKDKGIEELIEAFNMLKVKYSQIKLLLVGPFEPELDPVNEATANEIKTSDKIVHVGFQKDIRPYLAMSHVLTFPSYREGFPNVPLQAGCFNIPSIVSDINGCNEIIADGVNGLIIPPKNSRALAGAMETLLTRKNLYSLLKNNCRQAIIEKYDQKNFWKLLLKEYQTHLNEYAALS